MVVREEIEPNIYHKYIRNINIGNLEEVKQNLDGFI